MKKTTVTPQTVAHIAQLANIPVSEKEKQELATGFEETLAVVDELNSLDVQNISTTHQVTGLENVWREDQINQETMFTQQEALTNAHQTHNGFFVVPRILEEKDA
ncbi:MAG: Asp-tRNA(Asn)/Glu-tRNA(Gln) amidotransferase subunit GatC [Candidatus Pacebacteria bacterium]|nr:Asp-tRNA(Asn)/Glu-tRNA(Gln) amidotransferase subunit GatC [Candidatus Paceibacterota bacterium]